MITNTSITVKYNVQDKDLASQLPISDEDQFPQVFATSRMIALMEIAAARLMQPSLKEGELSVGVGVNIKHLAATLVNEEITVEATFNHMEGKLFEFTVEAFDDGGKIGAGTHTRAIVSEERLMKGAEKRKK